MSPKGKQWLRVALIVLAAAALCALLGATIYWTYFDPRWITFLGGVLFAAVLAVASQMSGAERRVTHGTLQLESARASLDEQVLRSRRVADALKACEARLGILGEALPGLVLFIDRDERCRYANRAAAQRMQRAQNSVAGCALRELVSTDVYDCMQPDLEASFSGTASSREVPWAGATYTARYIPFADGVCLMLSESAAAVPASGDGGQSLYVAALTGTENGWDDPHRKLAGALRDNQFLLLQQRIAPLAAGRPDPLCYEILLRLKEEEDNLLPPGGFFPVAERYGMMEQLDRWVLAELVARCLKRQLDERGWRPPLYCVNLSSAALASREFTNFVMQQVGSGFDARSLCFEISEPDILARRPEVQRLMSALKPLGCRFTVDAFGSVKPSFTALRDLPFDFLKIDGVIVQNILRNPAELAKARAIVAVCRKMGVRTIAEFVEDGATRGKLKEIDVDYVQGFGVARPEPLQMDARRPAPVTA